MNLDVIAISRLFSAQLFHRPADSWRQLISPTYIGSCIIVFILSLFHDSAFYPEIMLHQNVYVYVSLISSFSD